MQEDKFMTASQIKKLLHFFSTFWFVICVGYILVLSLRQANVRWWVIFSLSGYSFVIVLLSTSLYLFALFRGIGVSQESIEHPLTSTNSYVYFYITTPLLGGMAGLVGSIGINIFTRLLMGIALGTLGATFLVWIFIDPLIGMLETLLPASRKHHMERLAIAKEEKLKIQNENETLFAELHLKEELELKQWQKLLMPYAETLFSIIQSNRHDTKAQREVVDIGSKAWQIGGLNCMKQLHEMVMARSDNKISHDPISMWWDGIGNWYSPPLKERLKS